MLLSHLHDYARMAAGHVASLRNPRFLDALEKRDRQALIALAGCVKEMQRTCVRLLDDVEHALEPDLH